MAARKPIKPVDVDGVTVKIDTDYVKSWDGVMQAVEMQRLANDEDATDADKMMALFSYYSRAIANIDEIKESLGGGNVPADKVFDIATKALSSGSSKN